MQNITRRQAAKAIGLGTAAAFVAPAALASANPDADILEMARQIRHIETVIIPPLEKAHDEAEAKVFDVVPPQGPPSRTLEGIEKDQAQMLAMIRGDGGRSKMPREVLKERHPGVDCAAAVSLHFASDREAVEQYANWKTARLQAEKETGLFEKEQAMYRAHDEAEAIRERIVNTPARTEAGYRIKLKIAMDGKHPDTLANPEYITDKALVSLMRDLEASV